MSTTLPAMRAKFGSTEYYVVTMAARELVNNLVIPKDLPEWSSLTLEERFQREVNYKRVRDHIAPYLVNDADRFFGAFIVDIYNPKGVFFEPANDIIDKLPGIYRSSARLFGFLHFSGEEVLIPLDGQHRLVALKFAIEGNDQKGKPIRGLDPNLEVAKDLVTVILVKHDERKARKIFNKVNRYAKATSKADNLITADDDIVAVITRKIANKIIKERLVNYRTNTLTVRSQYFTTLATLYDSTDIMMEYLFDRKINKTVLPDEATRQRYHNEVKDHWWQIINGVTLFSRALKDPTEQGDSNRIHLRKRFLLCKPIAQLVLVDTIFRLRGTNASPSHLTMSDILGRINKIDWAIDNCLWQQVLMNGSRIMSGKQTARFAARFIAYYLGQKLYATELNALQEQYRSAFPEDQKKSLPQPVF